MGFRADFYIGRSKRALWLGSVREHGTPKDLKHLMRGCNHLLEFYNFVWELTFAFPDGVGREQGWPWPEDDSSLTDYVYAFEDGCIYVSCYGSPWVAFKELDCKSITDDYDFDSAPGPDPVFPNMRSPGLACV